MSIDPRISLQKLEVFERIVVDGGVSAAADSMMVAPPVVSAHLKLLEQRLGARLFFREGRHLELTEAGHAVWEWSSEVRRRTRELDRELAGLVEGAAGTVVVAASMSIGSYVLPRLLVGFARDRPSVTIRLDLRDAAMALADTESGENDFSVVSMSEPVRSRALHLEQIGYDEMVLIAPAVGLFDGRSIDSRALARLPFIDAPAGVIRRSLVDRGLAGIGIRERRVVLELGHAEAIKQAVVAGAGVAFVSRDAVARELDLHEVRLVTVDDFSLTVPVVIVSRVQKRLTPLQQALIDSIREHFTSRC